jgi:hypothetical protein
MYRRRGADGAPIGVAPADPWEYGVLRQYEVPMALDSALKDAIEKDRRLFGRFRRITLEAYQARDIYDWCRSKGFEADLVHMTWQAKAQLVRMWLELLATDRLRCSSENVLLFQECLNYREDLSSSTPSYEGPKRSVRVPGPKGDVDLTIKDDALESAMWAVWGLFARPRKNVTRSSASKPSGL